MTAPEQRLSTLQQERSRATREKLIRAAEKLWQEKGFDDTTVSDVCEAAGVAKGTFYFYFPHKEDLLIELSTATSNRSWNDASSAISGDQPVEEVLRSVVRGIARRVGRTPKDLLARTLIELYRHVDTWQERRTGEGSDFGSVFELVYRKGQERGEIPLDYHPRELAATTTSSLIQGMLGWARGMTGRMPLEEVLWRRALLVLNGARAGYTSSSS